MVSAVELALVSALEKVIDLDQAAAVTSVAETSTPAVVDQAAVVAVTTPGSSLVKTSRRKLV